jgi:hypothetical protein
MQDPEWYYFFGLIAASNPPTSKFSSAKITLRIFFQVWIQPLTSLMEV